MSITVKPSHECHLPITGGTYETVKNRVASLLDQFKPSYEEIIVYNLTRDCQVQVIIDGRILRVRITNAKEDEVFRFETETPKEENPDETPGVGI